MSATQLRPRPTKLALALVVMLALAGCGDSDTPVSPRSTAPAATPTPESSPTEAPVDIADEFVAKAGGLATFVADLSGTLRVGNLEGEVTGALEVVGSDMHNLTVITFPGLPEEREESISIDGISYQRTEHGYWLQLAGDGGGAGGDPVTGTLNNTAGLEVVGTEEHDGVTLHRIESSRPAAIPPEALGFNDPTIIDFEAEVAFLAEDDGTPAGIRITATWAQGPEGATVPGEFELLYLVVDRTATIEAPEDPWIQYASAELGYRVAHPADWDVSHEPATADLEMRDFYLGPIDGEVQVYRYTDLGGATANAWFRSSVAFLTENFGSEPELANMLSLSNGLEVQVFIGHYSEAEATYFYQEAVVFGGAVAWDLDWYSLAGNEAEDQVRFLQLVMSFEPAP